MPTEQRIFLESKPVGLSDNTAGHMYLVLRDVQVDANGNVISNVQNDNDLVLRGSSEVLSGALTTFSGLLSGSLDRYSPGDTPASRNSLDITSLILNGGDFSAVTDAWGALAAGVLGISGQYSYQVPDPLNSSAPIANSNSTIFSALAAYGVDARSIFDANGSRYVDSYFPFGMPGASTQTATLLATDSGQIISAANLADQQFFSSITLEGRDNVSDIFINSSLNERFYGEEGDLDDIGSGATDTVRYSSSQPGQGVDLTATVVTGVLSDHMHLSSEATGEDDLFGIELITPSISPSC